jgi:hypothetical protein
MVDRSCREMEESHVIETMRELYLLVIWCDVSSCWVSMRVPLRYGEATALAFSMPCFTKSSSMNASCER